MLYSLQNMLTFKTTGVKSGQQSYGTTLALLELFYRPLGLVCYVTTRLKQKKHFHPGSHPTMNRRCANKVLDLLKRSALEAKTLAKFTLKIL